jgi:endoribonuclease LACTB2
MLRLERLGDVTRIELWSWLGRRFGYTVSVYLVGDVLVDSGLPRAGRDLLRFVDERAAAGRPVRGVVITHWHEDHAGNVEALARRGIPLWLSDATRAALQAPAPLAAYRSLTWGTMAPLRTAVPSFDPAPLATVATPGHSRDHHAVWDPATATLFGGDLYLSVKVRVAHRDEDPRALARSLRAAAALEPARLFDAHRGLVPAPVDVLRAKAAWIDETVGAIERLASAGESRNAITRRVLGREPSIAVFSRGHYSHRAFVDAVLDGDAGAT